MKITFLGTGTSQGVPVIACQCEVCKSENPLDQRLRSSILIEANNNIFVIDSGPDFRQQVLRENLKRIDAIIFTHEHKDHISGLDDIRAFNYTLQKPMDVYAEQRVQTALKREYYYAFAENNYPGIPQLNLHLIDNEIFQINETVFLPVRVMHYHLPILGFRIGKFSYITDANFISKEEMEKIKNSKVLVINALRRKKHVSHFNLDEALQLINEVKPEKAFLTHISHLLGMHHSVEKELPENVFLAYDGLKIEVE